MDEITSEFNESDICCSRSELERILQNVIVGWEQGDNEIQISEIGLLRDLHSRVRQNQDMVISEEIGETQDSPIELIFEDGRSL